MGSRTFAVNSAMLFVLSLRLERRATIWKIAGKLDLANCTTKFKFKLCVCVCVCVCMCGLSVDFANQGVVLASDLLVAVEALRPVLFLCKQLLWGTHIFGPKPLDDPRRARHTGQLKTTFDQPTLFPPWSFLCYLAWYTTSCDPGSRQPSAIAYLLSSMEYKHAIRTSLS